METTPTLNPKRVTELMSQREMTRSQLCGKVGISESYASRFFNERTQITKPALIAKFAEAFEVEPERLITEPEVPIIRVATPPHLWSAPFLNLGEGAANGSGQPRFRILQGDQSFTGADALAALRRGDADLALAFETPLSMSDDSDVITLGSIRTGTDFVRLLIHRHSHLLADFEPFDVGGVFRRSGSPTLPGLGGATEPEHWSEAPTAAINGATIAAEYLRHLEKRMPGLDRIRLVEPDPRRPWLDRDGRAIHLILVWEPVAAAIGAAADGHFVDIFDAFAERLPAVWLPPSAEYRLMLSQERPLPPERLRQLIKDLHTATLQMNHFIGSSRIVLQNQPVIGRLISTLDYEMNDATRAALERLLAGRLAETRFQFQLSPDIFAKGLL